jgi:hypothetical protein
MEFAALCFCFRFVSRLGDFMIDWEEIIIALALAGSLSLWIFVVPEDEIAWRGGWHERLGGHYVLRREGKFYIWLARRWLPPS